MRRKIIIRPEARRDLAGIWRHTRREWGLDQAERYVAAIRLTVETIADNPDLGSDRSHIAPGLRKISVRSHAIYYFHDDRTLRVSRILHGRMDAESAL